jgi:fatty-acyl-CoA synthase
VKLEAEEIARYCREHITERAAIPKKIHIIDPMPITAVGKIFKPALRHHAIREVFAAELRTLSDLTQSIEIVVREEKTHGTTAYVTAKPAGGVDAVKIGERVDALLGRYTVHYELSVVSGGSEQTRNAG